MEISLLLFWQPVLDGREMLTLSSDKLEEQLDGKTHEA